MGEYILSQVARDKLLSASSYDWFIKSGRMYVRCSDVPGELPHDKRKLIGTLRQNREARFYVDTETGFKNLPKRMMLRELINTLV